MPTIHTAPSHIIVAHWGLAGSATKGQPGYRSQNPWQALEHYMESLRGDAATFFGQHGVAAIRIDSGGSVWNVELAAIPTPAGAGVKDFAEQLLAKLVAQNPRPEPDDRIFVSYADGAGVGRWAWMP